MALTVSLALFVTVILAKTIGGGVLPLVAKVLKTDPAIMAAPVITTIVDAFSLIIYLKSWKQFYFAETRGGGPGGPALRFRFLGGPGQEIPPPNRKLLARSKSTLGRGGLSCCR